MSQQPVSIRDAVLQRQRAHQLNREQLERLMKLQSGSSRAISRPRARRRMQLTLTAGVGLVAGLMLALWMGLHAPTPDGNEYRLRIADEVVMNHLKLRPLEVQSDNLDTVRRYFTALDFRPVQTAMLDGRQGQLLGARYCSVQGISAAQFRVQSLQGQVRTLYQARYDPKVHGPLPDIRKGELPLEMTARGVPVKIWVDSGLLFAQTGGQ